MSTELFHGFFDDAAVFPPGLTPLNEAVRNHIVRAKDNVTDPFIGPLVLPLKDIRTAAQYATELGAEASADSSAPMLDTSAVVPAGELASVEQLLTDLEATTTELTAVELKVGDDPAADIAEAAQFRSAHPDISVYVELPYSAVTEENLVALRDGEMGLKFRTGGITQDLYPTPEELIDVLNLAVKNEVRFKLTAGLHRAMRYLDEETGLKHYGFANIAATVRALQQGKSTAEAAELLASDDSSAIADAISQDTSWRENFLSFGTCSVDEPTGTLRDIELMEPDVAQRFVV